MRVGSFRPRDGFGCFFGRQIRRAGALQRINHRRLRGVVGGRIGAAGDGNRAVGRVVIGQIFLVLATVECSLGLVTELGIELRQVEVRRQERPAALDDVQNRVPASCGIGRRLSTKTPFAAPGWRAPFSRARSKSAPVR